MVEIYMSGNSYLVAILCHYKEHSLCTDVPSPSEETSVNRSR